MSEVEIDYLGNTVFPELSNSASKTMSVPSKPVLLKGSIVVKNEEHHSDVPRSEFLTIIWSALYETEVILPANPVKAYYNFIKRVSSDRSAIVLLDVSDSKEFFETVNFHWIDNHGRKRKEKLSNRIKEKD